MPYRLRITRRAQRELRRLPPEIMERIRDAINGLADNPHPPGYRKLRGGVGWRTRVGDYRVIYDVADDTQVVTVLRSGHKRDVYRGL